MLSDDVTGMFGVEPGCPTHGDEHMRECSMCGTEFCRRCFPRSAVCPDCADQTDDEDEKDNSDFDDITRVGMVVDDEDEEGEEKTEDSTEDVGEEDRERD